jgi:catechol 2,3-dioxygenase
VDNREDVLRAADIMRENHVFIEAGPSKHNNSQAFYLYSYEPGGNRVEVYSCGLQVFTPEWEVINWNEDERDGGVYWGARLPESFATYATPPVSAEQNAAARKFPVIDIA